MVMGMVKCPGWAMAMLNNGLPRFANIQPYAGAGASLNDTIRFARKEMGGAFSWEEVARYRDRWKGPLVVKGILHPADAEKAVALGVDGILVSNHGGRQIEALPAPVDCLPAIVRAVGGRATVLMDSGIRSGTDVARALALGASAALAGKAFLWGLGALGDDGPGHVIDLLIDETAVRARPDRRALAGRGALGRDPASWRAALLICAAGSGGAGTRQIERGPRPGFPGKSLDVGHCRTHSHCGRRRARAAQCAGAGGRAGARRRQQHGDCRDRRHRRLDAGARSRASRRCRSR